MATRGMRRFKLYPLEKNQLESHGQKSPGK